MMHTATQSGEDRRLEQDGTACVALPLTARSLAAGSEGLVALWNSGRSRAQRGWQKVEVGVEDHLGTGGEAW
jgi:hypothetical protein